MSAASSAQPFRQRDSGLYVPDEYSRIREVWTRDALRLINRVTKLLNSRGIQVMFACENPKCVDTKISKAPGLGGEYILRCNCKDRVFQRTF